MNECYEDISVFNTLQVDFDPSLDIRSKMTKLLHKGEKVFSGQANGLSLHIDTESYDHGYVPSFGK